MAMLGFISYFAYLKGWILTNFESISAKQAENMLKNDQIVTLLDVRTIEEFKEGHLRYARLIPLGELERNLHKLKDSKKKILVYCQSGFRSVSASRILEKNGFMPLNIKGGMNDLSKTGLEVLK